MATRWMVAGCFAFALAWPVRAADSLDDIKADLANCKGPPGCLHRTLLQARLNYRLKMIQMAEVTMASIAGSVPGASADLRRAVAGLAGGALAGNAGGQSRAVPANVRPTAAAPASPTPAAANPNPAPLPPRPSAASPTPAASVQNRAAARPMPGAWPLHVALSEAISADAIKSSHNFRALSLTPVMSGGRVIVPRGVMVYLKVRALGPGPQPNSLRLALAVDYAEFNGSRVPLASNEIQRVIFTVSGGRPRPGFPYGLGVNTRLPFAVSPATAASPNR